MSGHPDVKPPTSIFPFHHQAPVYLHFSRCLSLHDAGRYPRGHAGRCDSSPTANARPTTNEERLQAKERSLDTQTFNQRIANGFRGSRVRELLFGFSNQCVFFLWCISDQPMATVEHKIEDSNHEKQRHAPYGGAVI